MSGSERLRRLATPTGCDNHAGEPAPPTPNSRGVLSGTFYIARDRLAVHGTDCKAGNTHRVDRALSSTHSFIATIHSIWTD